MDEANDDMIDFRKLEAELATAMAKDEKYQRENDAKFRAIRQKVASYDEFRDIVLASHLKPLDKKDISGGMPYQAWNKVVSNSGFQAGISHDMSPKTGCWIIPNTTAEFDKTWKHSCKTATEKIDFLRQIDPSTLKIIFAIDAPLGEIAACIKVEGIFPDDLKTVIQILEVISDSKRFSLMLDFLDSQEKKDLSEIFLSCEDAVKGVANEDSELSQEIGKLKAKYKLP